MLLDYLGLPYLTYPHFTLCTTDYSRLEIYGLVGTYEQALAQLEPTSFPTRTICFLGGTLGNLMPEESDRFFANLTKTLKAGDYFLVGIDLPKKTRDSRSSI